MPRNIKIPRVLKSKYISAHIPIGLYNRLNNYCRKNYLTRSQAISRMLKTYAKDEDMRERIELTDEQCDILIGKYIGYIKRLRTMSDQYGILAVNEILLDAHKFGLSEEKLSKILVAMERHAFIEIFMKRFKGQSYECIKWTPLGRRIHSDGLKYVRANANAYAAYLVDTPECAPDSKG